MWAVSFTFSFAKQDMTFLLTAPINISTNQTQSKTQIWSQNKSNPIKCVSSIFTSRRTWVYKILAKFRCIKNSFNTEIKIPSVTCEHIKEEDCRERNSTITKKTGKIRIKKKKKKKSLHSGKNWCIQYKYYMMIIFL